MKKIHYNKLIRDRIPEKILKKGSTLKTRTLRRDEFERELRKKIVEEASGVATARSPLELLDELADLQMVIDTLKRYKNLSPHTVRDAYRSNLKKKGGFKKRIFLYWSSDDQYRSNESNVRR